jgi:hypothetical protein
MKNPFKETTHEETTPEFHQRVQERMDTDSWIGRDTVACDFPERAIVHDITPPEDREPPHVFNYGKRRGY